MIPLAFDQFVAGEMSRVLVQNVLKEKLSISINNDATTNQIIFTIIYIVKSILYCAVEMFEIEKP